MHYKLGDSMFFYKAKNLKGSIIKGKHYGYDLDKLQYELRSKGFYITTVRKIGIPTFKKGLFKSKMTYEDLQIFSQELSTLMEAGIKLPVAVQLLEDCFKSNEIKSYIKDIADSLYQGKSLYHSMKKYEYIFDNFILTMVSIGENTGRLEYTLKQTAKYYKNMHKIKCSIKKGTSYPKFIFYTFIVICFIIFKFVLPEFMKIGEGFNLNNDALIIKMYKIFNFITNNLIIEIVTLGFMLGVVLCINKNKKKLIIYMLNTISYFKEKYLKHKITRVFKCISIMMQSGVSLVDSLEKCYDITYDNETKKVILRIENKLINGNTFSEAIECENFISRTWKTIIQIGEETATLDKALMRISENYEENLLKNINVATKFIEPSMIIIIAILVGAMAIALMSPIIELTDSII